MRRHTINGRTTSTGAPPATRPAADAAAWLAIAALLGPATAAAHTRVPRPAPAAPDQPREQLGLSLRITGAVTARVALTAPPDAMHRCVIPDTPGAEYLLSFGGPPGPALLDPARPGLVISLARHHATTPATRDAATPAERADAPTLAASDSARADASASAGEPAPGATIQMSIRGRRFIGIGGMDPEYRLSVALSAGGQRGSFTARHLVDASGSGAVDVAGTWRCPGAASAETPPAPAAPTAEPPAGDPASGSQAGAAVPIPVPAPVIAPLGRATATLTDPPRHGRSHSRRADRQKPGCTSMATLDGVSAALQAGPFGRRLGLAIMQFRNVVTDSVRRGQVSCHADVVLSDSSLHRAEYGLRSTGSRTQLHVRVGREQVGADTGSVTTPPPEHHVPEAAPAEPPGPAT